MPRTRRTSLTVTLTPTERAILCRWRRSRTMPALIGHRAHMLLLVADGHPVGVILTTLGISRRTLTTWVHRFQAARLAGVFDALGDGRHVLALLPAVEDR